MNPQAIRISVEEDVQAGDGATIVDASTSNTDLGFGQRIASMWSKVLASKGVQRVRTSGAGLSKRLRESKTFGTFRRHRMTLTSKVKQTSVFRYLSKRWSILRSAVVTSEAYRSVRQHAVDYAAVFKTSKKHQSVALAVLLVSLPLSAFVLHGALTDDSSDGALDSAVDEDMQFTVPSNLSLVSNATLDMDSTGGTIESSGVSMSFGAGALNTTLNLSLEVFQPPAELDRISTSPVLSTYAVHLDVNETARLNGTIRLTLPPVEGVSENPEGIVLGVIRGGIVVPQDIPMTYNWSSGKLQADLDLGTLFPSDLVAMDSPHFAAGLAIAAADWGSWLYRNKEALVATRDCAWESFWGGQTVRIRDAHLDLLVPNQLGKNSRTHAQNLFDGKLWEARIVLTNHLDFYIPTIKGKQGKASPYDICWVYFSKYDALPNGADGVTIPSSPHFQGMTFVNMAAKNRSSTTVHEYIHALSVSVWNDPLISDLAGMSLASKIPYAKEVPKAMTIRANLVKWQPQTVEENYWFFEASTVTMTRTIMNGTPGIDPTEPSVYQFQTNLGRQSLPPEASQAFFAWLEHRVQGDDSRNGISRLHEFRVLYEGVTPQPQRSVAEDAFDYLAQWLLRGDADAGDLWRLHLQDLFGPGRTSGFYGAVQGPRLNVDDEACEASSSLEPFSFDLIRSTASIEPMINGTGVWALPIQDGSPVGSWVEVGVESHIMDIDTTQPVDVVLFHDGVESRETLDVEVDVCPYEEEERNPPTISGPTWELTDTFLLGSSPIHFSPQRMNTWPDRDEWNWTWTYDLGGLMLSGYNTSNPEETWSVEINLMDIPSTMTDTDNDGRIMGGNITYQFVYREENTDGASNDGYYSGDTWHDSYENWGDMFREENGISLFIGPEGTQPSNNGTSWYWVNGTIWWWDGEVFDEYNGSERMIQTGSAFVTNESVVESQMTFGHIYIEGVADLETFIKLPEEIPDSFWIVVSPLYPFSVGSTHHPPCPYITTCDRACNFCTEDHGAFNTMIEGHGIVLEYTRTR